MVSTTGRAMGDDECMSMLRLASCRIDSLVRETEAIGLYRGRRSSDGLPVVVKVVRGEYPRPGELARLRREFDLLRGIDAPEVVEAIALEPIGNTVALIERDAGPESLEALVRRAPLPIDELLRVAIAMTRAVEVIHDHEIIHKDLKPDHFFWGGGETATIVDFGIAATFAEQRSTSSNALEGTLAYVSPEQTGWVDRPVDARSDLYALGVSIFELATGRRPFTAADPLELAHCHVAREPPALNELRPDAPPVLGAMVMKLLAKDPEDRYQTAAGLRHDLERCAALYSRGARRALAEMQLGTRDRSPSLRLSQKLYHREAELRSLFEAFESSREGPCALALIAGPAGIGKSALVQELRRRLVPGGHFVSAKFDQLARNAPHEVITGVCRQLAGALFTRSASELDAWRRRFDAALGVNGQVLVDLLPELRELVGERPALVPLGPRESRNRLEGAIASFVGLFASPSTPVVIFVDDLQWADAASLGVIEQLLGTLERGLIVVGAYRDAEVGPEHPASATFARARASGASVTVTTLEPLDAGDVTRLLVDTLGAGAEEVAPLGAAIHESTGGNPFYIGQLIVELERRGHLRFDRSACRWRWDLAEIVGRYATENVVDLVLATLSELPDVTRDVLEAAAAIGYRFDTSELESACDRSRGEVVEGIRSALHQGFIVALDPSYAQALAQLAAGEPRSPPASASLRFIHDRVQQAAYGLLSEAERPRVHLRIARGLRRLAGETPETDRLFELADHMNRARAADESELAGGARGDRSRVGPAPSGPGPEDSEERRWLAGVNLAAGRRALGGGAAPVAAEYLARAIELLGPGAWAEDYEMVSEAHLLAAESAYLAGDDGAARALIATLDARATSVLHRAAARDVSIHIDTRQGRFREAIHTAAGTLELLGAPIPSPDDGAAIAAAVDLEFGRMQEALSATTIEGLRRLPELEDPRQRQILQTISAVVPAAYQAYPALSALLILLAAQVSMRHGLGVLSPRVLAQYALVHAAITGDHDTALRLGRAAVEIAGGDRYRAIVGSTHFVFATFVAHWREPLRVSLEHLDVAYQRSVEAGDFVHASYTIGLGTNLHLYAGEPLGDVGALAARNLATAVARLGDVVAIDLLRVCVRTVAALRGESEAPGSLDGDGFEERSMEEPRAFSVAASVYATNKAMARYYAGRFSEALSALEAVQPLPGHYYNVECAYYAALASAELARSSPSQEEQARHLARVEASVRRFEGWGNPHHEHRLALLRAELAGLRGDSLAAMSLYDAAIAGAQQSGMIHHEATACELSGRFHMRAGRSRIARAYIKDAQYAYERWGAISKREGLVEVQKTLLDTQGAAAEEPLRTLAVSSVEQGLDVLSAIRAARTLAGELGLDRLIERLMRLLVEAAGARRGVLILAEGGALRVMATMSGDPRATCQRLNEPMSSRLDLPAQMVRYVARTGAVLVLSDAARSERFASDPYVERERPRSVLCLPLVHEGRVGAVVYLENNLITDAFNAKRVEYIGFLATAAAVALENARLYGALEQSEAKFRRVSESNMIGILFASLGGEIREANDYFASLVGYSRKELSEGRVRWVDLTPPEWAAADQRAVGELRSTGRCQAYEKEYARKDGSRVPVLLGSALLEGSSEEVVAFVLDITERRRAEEERQRLLVQEKEARIEAERATRVREEFMEVAAHELRTPLTPLRLQLHLLRSTLTGRRRAAPGRAPDLPKLLDVAELQLERLNRLVEDLLEVSTIRAGHLELDSQPTDLSEVVQEVLQRQLQRATSPIDASRVEPVRGRWDRRRLAEVVANLLSNAVKYGQGKPVEVSAERRGDKAYLRVRDHGVGIAEADRERIFSRYERAVSTRHFGGFGLGLYLSREIVSAHGGRISVESRLGEGATFIVELPVSCHPGPR